MNKLDAMGLKSNKLLRSKTTKDDYRRTSYKPAMKEVAVLNAGKGFGELALISNKPRAATIKTKSPCYFATLGKEEYQNIYGVLERNKLSRKVSFIKNLRLFSLLTKTVIAKLSYFFEDFKIERNQYLYKQGEKVDY
jgi:CRP-like cAMP-binding protein